jgi:hypothetical protein
VIKFLQVTELVHDQIVLQSWREKHDAVVEVQIMLSRAAAPARPLVAYRDAVIGETVVLVEVCEPRVHQRSRGLFVLSVFPLARLLARPPSPHEPPQPQFINDQVAVIVPRNLYFWNTG